MEKTETVSKPQKPVLSTPWFGHLRNIETTIKGLESELEKAKTKKREIEDTLDDMAPFECGVCGRGIWDADKPHIHTNVFSRRKPQSKYTARIVRRPNAKGQ